MKLKIALVLFPVATLAQVTTFIDGNGQTEMYATQVNNNTFYTNAAGQDIASATTNGNVTTFIDNSGHLLGAAITNPPPVNYPLAPPQPPQPPEPPTYRP